LLIADCFALMIYVCQRFLFPGYDVISYPCWAVSFLAEFGFSLWLLIMGTKKQEPIAVEVG